ncbi:MAG: response regulator transcription factor [Flavobacteriales bacterium]|nr:response regulator transcription factor [Flavobacteriales bacterium]
MEKIRILVVDDHPMMRGGILSLLNRQGDMEVVGEADSGHEAIELIGQLAPDLVVMDINLNGVIDVRSTEEIKERWPNVHVVAFSMHNEVQVIRRMLKAGAAAYLTKSAPHDELIMAIRSVMRGGIYYDSEVMGVMADSVANGYEEISPDMNLSAREREVLYFVSKEFTNQEMADRMDISLRTVETHKRNLVKKLRVKNVVGLVRYAMDNGPLLER